MRCKYLLLIILPTVCLLSCKKSSKTPDSSVTIVGKWFLKKQNSSLFYNGAQISTFNKTDFTTNDFTEYYADGTGYVSQNSSNGPSLTQFNYTLKDSTLTQYNGANAGTTVATIVSLTANSLAIHAQSTVSDPNNEGQLETEIDDGTYSR